MTTSARPTPAQVWRSLAEGNERFAAGTPAHPNQDVERRASLLTGQDPHTVMFGCGDSRVAAEMIFDQGLGDLFVVRTAGHVFDDTVLGSLEFGVEVLGAELLVVLGHDSCGAIKAAAAVAASDDHTPPGHIATITDRLVPGVRASLDAGRSHPDDMTADHVRETVRALVAASPVIRARVEAGTLALVGAQYALSDGRVKILCSIGELGSA